MTKDNFKNVSIALRKNSYDFIEKGLEAIISDNEQEYKYAILHLYSGIILFLKDVLYKEHWVLIFQDVDKADKSKLFNGTIKSVNHDTLINRLRKINIFNLSEEFYKELNWLREQRNKIEHLHNKLNPHEVRSRIAIFLNRIYEIYHDYESSSNNVVDLENRNIVVGYKSLFELIKNYSFEFDDFIEKRLALIKGRLKESFLVLRCPNCSQKTLEVIPDDLRCICHFCSTSSSADEFYYNNSKDYLYEIEYGYDRPNCPNCQSEKLLKQSLDIVCFDCFKYYSFDSLTDCARCGVRVIYENHEYEAVFCENCINFIQGQ